MTNERKQEVLKNLEDYNFTLRSKQDSIVAKLRENEIKINVLKGELAAPSND